MAKFILILILGAAIVYGAVRWFRNKNGMDVVEYQGQQIRLSKKYLNFSEYKNDPANIALFETAKVQSLVEHAPIAHYFPTKLELFRATGEIQFPGYGSGSGGGPQADGSELIAVTVEIPRAEKDRYLVFRGRNGRYQLIDDFVEREIADPFYIREESGQYAYYSQRDHLVFRRSHQLSIQ